MDDQICAPPLQLPLLLHKDNNGDDIKDDYGQTLDDEDHKPWNTEAEDKRSIFSELCHFKNNRKYLN